MATIPETHAAALRPVRLAARRAALGRDWWAGCVNGPALLGVPDSEIRQAWREAGARAKHLLGVLTVEVRR
jgi:hypothetical protein